MKKIYFILIVLCQVGFSYAQEKQEIIKECVFEYAYFYTKNYKGAKEKKFYKENLAPFFKSSVEHREIDEITDTLSTSEFVKFSDKLKKIIEELDETQIVTSFFAGVEKSNVEKDRNYNGSKEEREKLKSKLLAKYPDEVGIVGDEPQEEDKVLGSLNSTGKSETAANSEIPKKQERKRGDSKDRIQFIIAVFLILFCFLLVLLWFLYQKNKKLTIQLEQLNNKLIEEKKQRQVANQKYNENYELKIKELNEQNDKLTTELKELKEQYLNPSITKEWDIKPQTNPVFYAGIPNSDGVFTKVLETKNDDIGFYELVVKGETAEFQFNSEEKYMQGTIYVTDVIIQPACKEENQCKNDTKQIKTIKKGKAVKQGEQWKIIEKAVIRYE